MISTCAARTPRRLNIMWYMLISISCPAAAHACLSMKLSGLETCSLLSPSWTRPRPTAPLDTSITSRPSCFSSRSDSTSAPMRDSAIVPSGFATTAVPTLTTIRLAFLSFSRSASTPDASPRPLAPAIAPARHPSDGPNRATSVLVARAASISTPSGPRPGSPPSDSSPALCEVSRAT